MGGSVIRPGVGTVVGVATGPAAEGAGDKLGTVAVGEPADGVVDVGVAGSDVSNAVGTIVDSTNVGATVGASVGAFVAGLL